MSFTAIIGVLTLVLAASALTEKAHEDHLPERNRKGTFEALIVFGLPAGILSLLACLFRSGNPQHRCNNKTAATACRVKPDSTFRDTSFAMEWPMRTQYS